MQVVQVLAVNEKVEHVITLPANLQTGFNPIQSRGLEELRGLQLSEQVLLRHCSLRPRL